MPEKDPPDRRITFLPTLPFNLNAPAVTATISSFSGTEQGWCLHSMPKGAQGDRSPPARRPEGREAPF